MSSWSDSNRIWIVFRCLHLYTHRFHTWDSSQEKLQKIVEYVFLDFYCFRHVLQHVFCRIVGRRCRFHGTEKPNNFEFCQSTMSIQRYLRTSTYFEKLWRNHRTTCLPIFVFVDISRWHQHVEEHLLSFSWTVQDCYDLIIRISLSSHAQYSMKINRIESQSHT